MIGELGFTLFFGAFQESVHRHFVAGVGFFEFGILVFDGAAGCGDGAQFLGQPVDLPDLIRGVGFGAGLEFLKAFSVFVTRLFISHGNGRESAFGDGFQAFGVMVRLVDQAGEVEDVERFFGRRQEREQDLGAGIFAVFPKEKLQP